MLNILLDRSDIVKTLMTTDRAEVLEAYVTEMLRVDPPIQGIYREAKANEVVGSTSLTPGDLVFLNFATANKNVSLRFFFHLWNDSHGTLGACIFAAHEDRSLSPQGALPPWRHFDQDS